MAVSTAGILLLLTIGGLATGRLINRAAQRLPKAEIAWSSQFFDMSGKRLPGTRWWPEWLPQLDAVLPAWRAVWTNTIGSRTEAWQWWSVAEWPLVHSRYEWRQSDYVPRSLFVEIGNTAFWVLAYSIFVPWWSAGGLAGSPFVGGLGPRLLEAGQNVLPVAMDSGGLYWPLVMKWLYFLFLLEVLLLATLIDLDLQIIPDSVTVPGFIVGLGAPLAWSKLWLVPVWFQDPFLLEGLAGAAPTWMSGMLSWPRIPAWIAAAPGLHAIAVSAAGCVVGWCLILVVRWLGKWALKEEAMGFGDVILMGVIGSFLGWQATTMVFFLAPLLALVIVAGNFALWCVGVSTADRRIPYGPYLSLAAAVVVLGWGAFAEPIDRVFSLGPLLSVFAIALVTLLGASLYLLQRLKMVLGFGGIEEQEHWTSADQLAFFASQDKSAGGFARSSDRWQGELSGRGGQFVSIWKSGSR